LLGLVVLLGEVLGFGGVLGVAEGLVLELGPALPVGVAANVVSATGDRLGGLAAGFAGPQAVRLARLARLAIRTAPRSAAFLFLMWSSPAAPDARDDPRLPEVTRGEVDPVARRD
jgi:hypothetical protein